MDFITAFAFANIVSTIDTVIPKLLIIARVSPFEDSIAFLF